MFPVLSIVAYMLRQIERKQSYVNLHFIVLDPVSTMRMLRFGSVLRVWISYRDPSICQILNP